MTGTTFDRATIQDYGFWAVWHYCQSLLKDADARTREEFDEELMEQAIRLLPPSKREDLVLFACEMATCFETYGTLKEPA